MSRPASPYADQWTLDSEAIFLNHGSFGACPRVVLERQDEIRRRMERQPVLFLGREWESMLDESRSALAKFVGAQGEDICFVPNATAGVNTVLRSLELQPGDELLVTDHAYNACRNALDFVAERSGCKVVIAKIPFPLEDPETVTESIIEASGPNTRIALIDHVSSPTALVLPIADIVSALDARGIDTLVDAAHAPGMLPLDIDSIGAAYYTGNCHKWVCSPKGSAFLHVRPDRQQTVRPLVISHGANSPRADRSRFRIEGDWIGTLDPSPWLCIPTAIEFMGSLFPGGWDELRRHNRDLVLAGRALLTQALEIGPPCPDSMIGSIASVPLELTEAGPGPLYLDPLHVSLWQQQRIEAPIMHWPSPRLRLLRISAQAYNHLDQYRLLADAIRESTR